MQAGSSCLSFFFCGKKNHLQLSSCESSALTDDEEAEMAYRNAAVTKLEESQREWSGTCCSPHSRLCLCFHLCKVECPPIFSN